MFKLNQNSYKILVGIGSVMVAAAIGYLIVRAAPDSISDTFTTEEKIASKTNLVFCGGQVKLVEESWTTITECNCDSLSGWYWYTTNGRSACWSKTLANSVSWNKGVGDDTDNPGDYTCATDVTALKDRMVAVAAGEWYKIVSNVAGTAITSSHNGSAGYSVISALAIADCVDGTRDLCTGNGCLGASVSAVNTSLATWASATGNKSALPYCVGGDCSTSANNDWRNACEQSSGYDLPLNCCVANIFYKNQKVCNDGDTNYTWAAAAYGAATARKLGGDSCSSVYYDYTSRTYDSLGFRVAVRP
jgi:hypothetical protein